MADEPYDVPADGHGRVSAVRRRSGLDRRQVDQGDGVRAGQSGGRASHHRVPGAAGRDAQRPGRPAAHELAGRVCPGSAAAGARRRAWPVTCKRGPKLLFEMHYTPNGTAQKDRSYVGFVFADPKTVKKEVAVQNAGNFTFKIPPGDPNYEVESEFVFRQNAMLLVDFAAHARARQGFSLRPDLSGRQEGNDAVGAALRLRLADDLSAGRAEACCRKGTKMHCVAHFDNSADNLANPDPTKEVGWGEQTWEEMMFGWFEMSLADQDLTQPATASACGSRSSWRRPTRSSSTISSRPWPAAR